MSECWDDKTIKSQSAGDCKILKCQSAGDDKTIKSQSAGDDKTIKSQTAGDDKTIKSQTAGDDKTLRRQSRVLGLRPSAEDDKTMMIKERITQYMGLGSWTAHSTWGWRHGQHTVPGVGVIDSTQYLGLGS